MATKEPLKNLHGFIQAYTIEKGCEYTHTSLNAPSSSFYVPANRLDEFYTLYEKAIAKGDHLYITEKNRHIGPVVVDIDLRFAMSDDLLAETNHVYTNETLDAIVNAYATVMNKYLDIGVSCKAHVMEKTKHVECKGVIKDGIHIVFPEIVTKASVKHLVRKEVMVLLEPVFAAIGATNKIDDIVDESIIERNNWFMYGSKKRGGEPYAVTRVYELNGSRGASSFIPKYKHDDDGSLVRLFSIRNKNREIRVKPEQVETVTAFEAKEEETRRNMHVTKRIIGTEINQKTAHCENIEHIESIVDLLNVDRCKNYEQWIRLGWCLRSIDNRLVKKWDEFSAKCPSKYKRGECERLWDRMRDSGISIGSLHMWARQDNPEGYKELIKNDLKTLLYNSLSMTHYDIAKVVHQMFQSEFVCCSYKNRYWYEFRNHRWNVSDSGIGLRNRLSEDVWRVYKSEAIEVGQKALASTNPGDQTKYDELQKKFNDIGSKLRNSSFKENIMKECSELFYIDKFEDKLDSNMHLMGFCNGIYDLETHTFRDGRPDDYVSFSTGNNYVPYEPDHHIMVAINEYLEQVLTNKAVREYVLKLYGTFISGHTKEQKFYIWTGSGSNSKSLLVELFEKSFGEYCCKFPITLLTQKRCASNAANSELARAKGKRFACLQEPSEDEKINIGLMKELSGGDKIMARALYKEPFEFVPQFKMLLLCNQLPHVPSDDGGTWRRIRVVEFTSKFVDDPQEENEFQIDYDLSTRMVEWRERFMSLLIHYYKKYEIEGITEPAEVMKCTTDYKSQNDHMAYFTSNYLERKEGMFLSLDDAHLEMRAYIKDDAIPIRTMSKPELDRYLSKNLTKSVGHNGVKGYRGWRIKSLVPAADASGGEGSATAVVARGSAITTLSKPSKPSSAKLESSSDEEED